MPRWIDETGNTYGKWTVIKKVPNPKKNGALFQCRCECGREQEILGKRLRAGETTQCTDCQAKNHIKNYAGYKFNKLTVLEDYDHKNGRIYWHCLCDCGNDTWVSTGNLVSGEVKSCGCLSGTCNRHLEDLTNQTFFDLTVIKESEISLKQGRRYWDCQCVCGNKTIVKTSDLTTGKVKSCGCRKTSPIHKGAIYGLLTVIKPTEKRASNGSIIYKCKCKCGNFCEVPATNLIKGNWKSCGCMKNKSYGEEKISQILKDKNINFVEQKTFDNCKTDMGRKYKFDFFVDNTYIIEYDGSQHFTYTNSGWDTKEHFIRTRKSDLIKNKFCFDNNIPIIRIPYNSDFKEEDLFLETTQFLLTSENQNNYYSNNSNDVNH